MSGPRERTRAASGPQGRLRALYICYLSLDDPLVHTQVVAYLRGLAAAGHVIHLLTFETRRLTRVERAARRAELAAAGIAWHGLRYHKRPSLPATVFDTFAGAARAGTLVVRHRLRVVHARNHVPAAMWLLLRPLIPSGRRPAFIFDIRGLMAEEYVDAGRWVAGGAPYRLTKAVERAALDVADGVVVLTDRARTLLFGDAPRDGVCVIPCCADIAAPTPAGGREQARERIRAELQLGGRLVLVYVGKFGGWYLDREMAAFFAALRTRRPDAHFLILTQAGRAQIAAALTREGAPPASFTITSVPHDQVGDHLAAADLAISFIEPSPSKIASSPTKVGEYLAAGLPVLSTAGVGDLDAILGGGGVGVLVREHTPDAYGLAIVEIEALLADPGTGARCRAVADAQLSLDRVGIPRYRALYASVAARRARTRPAAAITRTGP